MRGVYASEEAYMASLERAWTRNGEIQGDEAARRELPFGVRAIADKKVFYATQPHYDADVWIEAESDLCILLMPPNGGARFEYDTEHYLGERLNDVLRRMYDGVCEVRGEFYDHREHHRIAATSDPTRIGCDMVRLQFVGLTRKPLWYDLAADTLREMTDAFRRNEV